MIFHTDSFILLFWGKILYFPAYLKKKKVSVNITDFIIKGVVLILVAVRFHYRCPIIFGVLKSIVARFLSITDSIHSSS